MEHERSAWRISLFLLLTFVATWSLWVPVLRAARRYPDASHVPPLLAFGGPVFLLGVFAPGLLAIAFTLQQGGGRAGELLERLVRWRVDIRLYAFALLLMPATKLAVAVLHRLFTGVWPAFGETRPLVLVIATILSTPWQAGEELGWRGYLLPRLAEHLGLARASLLAGIFWAAWHLPLFFAPGTDTSGQSFPLFVLQVTAYSAVLSWVYWRSGGSLLLTMLMHAALNNTKDIVPSRGVPSGTPLTLDSTLVSRLTVLLLWVVAAFLLYRMSGVRSVERRDDSPSSAP